MTDRRSGPPLFDLMRERGDRPQAPKPQDSQQPPKDQQPKGGESRPDATSTASVAQSLPQPRPAQSESRSTAWDSTGGVSRAERSAAAMLDEPVPSDSGITLSVPKFYTMIAVALVLMVGAWAGGYRIGYTDGKEEISQFVRDQPVISPQAGSVPANQPGAQPGTTNQPGTQPQQQPAQNQPTTQAGSPRSIMTPTGFRAQDPRAAGMNYLVLATLPTEQASDAIKFMSENGITIIGVPQLDSRAGSANNPSRYTLYSLGLAIPGNRWSAMSNQRLEHQRQIASLGSRWQRERRGGSDFSQTHWEKYEP